MQARPRAEQIERETVRQAEQSVAIEEDGNALRVVGLVDSPEAVQAVLDVVRSVAPNMQIVNDLEVMQNVVETNDPADLFAEPPSVDREDSISDTAIPEDIEDYADSGILTDPIAAAGPSESADDVVESGDEVYVPPVDPVITMD
ncbi:MAG: hypothetical protein QOF51_1476, partial [Chloroflexota bacterium]|nr:hypothetical protein [Chloroflexota bacterium]